MPQIEEIVSSPPKSNLNSRPDNLADIPEEPKMTDSQPDTKQTDAATAAQDPKAQEKLREQIKEMRSDLTTKANDVEAGIKEQQEIDQKISALAMEIIDVQKKLLRASAGLRDEEDEKKLAKKNAELDSLKSDQSAQLRKNNLLLVALVNAQGRLLSVVNFDSVK